MKKYVCLIALTGCMCAFLSGCNNKNDSDAKEVHDSAAVSEPPAEVLVLDDAEITIPAGLVGEELSDDSIVYVDEDSANITYSLSAHERTEIINTIADGIAESISVILSDKDHYPDIVSISPNADYTEFTIGLSGGTVNTYESMLAMSFYIIGNKYQIYNGVDAGQAVTTVRYLDTSTNSVINESDSTGMVTQPE